MNITQHDVDSLKDIIWFLKGYNKTDDTPFNEMHTDSLLNAILFIQEEIDKKGEQNEITK